MLCHFIVKAIFHSSQEKHTCPCQKLPHPSGSPAEARLLCLIYSPTRIWFARPAFSKPGPLASGNVPQAAPVAAATTSDLCKHCVTHRDDCSGLSKDKMPLWSALPSSVTPVGLVAQSCPTLPPHRLKPAKLLCPWDSPGKNTGVGCHFLLQAIFPTQGSNSHLLQLLHCRQILYQLSQMGSFL